MEKKLCLDFLAIVAIRSEKAYMYGQIKEALAKESMEASISAISRFLKKNQETKSFKDRQRSGRPKLLIAKERQMIDQWLAQNDELSTTELLKLF